MFSVDAKHIPAAKKRPRFSSRNVYYSFPCVSKIFGMDASFNII